jgi:enoyl-CoA hydratase
MKAVVDGRVAVLTLRNGPLNVVDEHLLKDIDRALDGFEADPNICVVRIRSAGKMFSAGADLRLLSGYLASPAGPDDMVVFLERFHALFDRIEHLRMATFAEIEGFAIGGGLELALACDLRLATCQAKLGLTELRVGLLPGSGGTQRLTRLCGLSMASRMILTGEMIDGRDAERLGLVEWAFDAVDFKTRVEDIVSRTADLAPESLSLAKNASSRP